MDSTKRIMDLINITSELVDILVEENEALKEFTVRREHQKVLGLLGTVDYFEDYEPKKFRSK